MKLRCCPLSQKRYCVEKERVPFLVERAKLKCRERDVEGECSWHWHQAGVLIFQAASKMRVKINPVYAPSTLKGKYFIYIYIYIYERTNVRKATLYKMWRWASGLFTNSFESAVRLIILHEAELERINHGTNIRRARTPYITRIITIDHRRAEENCGRWYMNGGTAHTWFQWFHLRVR